MSSHFEVLDSAKMLKAGVEAVSDRANIGYIPGVGLVVAAEWMGDMDLATIRRRLEALSVGMSATVEGLGHGERVFICWSGAEFGEDAHYVVLGIKPDVPGSLEVYVDGKMT